MDRASQPVQKAVSVALIMYFSSKSSTDPRMHVYRIGKFGVDRAVRLLSRAGGFPTSCDGDVREGDEGKEVYRHRNCTVLVDL
jgi:hypothetical protein